MRSEHKPVAFIGGGNMTRAILDGARDAGVLDPSRCPVAEPDPDRRSAFPMGLLTATDALERLASIEPEPGSGQVVLAVKPQVLASVADEIRLVLDRGPSRVIISILAGTPSPKIRRALGPSARVVRVMPNTPARVGRGMSAVCPGEGAHPGDEALAERIMRGVGRVVRIEEGLMDAFTALAGSGPAYVFYLAEALAAAGVEAGFDADESEEIARQVVAGAGELLVRDPTPPAELRRAVTSKGGTTAAAIEVLDREGVMRIVEQAVLAARDRGRALAEE